MYKTEVSVSWYMKHMLSYKVTSMCLFWETVIDDLDIEKYKVNRIQLFHESLFNTWKLHTSKCLEQSKNMPIVVDKKILKLISQLTHFS